MQDDRGRSLLHWAIGCQQKEVFSFLIEKGININLADNVNRTPLHAAVQANEESYFNTLHQLQPTTSWIKQYGTTLLELSLIHI